MANKNRLLKVALFEAIHANLMGAVVVGQSGDTIIVERPQPKQREKKAAGTRKPRTPKVPTQPATSFPPVESARG